MKNRNDRKCKGLSCILLLAFGIVAGSTQVLDAAVKLPRTIQITVNTTPGGGSDAFARFLVKWLPKYVPGSPQFVIRYMPGASNTLGRNYLYNSAPNDGSVWGIASGGDQLAGLYGWKSIKYDIRKQKPIMGLSGGTLVYTTPEIAKNWDQVYEKEILMWGYQPAYGSQQDAFVFLAQEMLGFKVKKYIFSYGGSGEARRGYIYGVINFSGATVNSYTGFDRETKKAGELGFVIQLGGFNEKGEIVRKDPPVGHH